MIVPLKEKDWSPIEFMKSDFYEGVMTRLADKGKAIEMDSWQQLPPPSERKKKYEETRINSVNSLERVMAQYEQLLKAPEMDLEVIVDL
jgi:hypothetical protein